MFKRIFKENDYINIYIGFLYILPAVFFSHLSKEIPVFLLIYLSVFNLQKLKYLKYIPLILIAFLIRDYWLIIIINVIILCLLSKSLLSKFFYSLVSISFFIIIYEKILNANTSSIRDNLTNFRIGGLDSDSLISNPNFFNAGILNDLTNYYYSILIIVTPLLVVNEIKIQYLILTIIQLYIIVHIIKLKLNSFSKSDIFLFNIFVSTLMTIILFEPDLGSFSRHEFILLPFLAYLLNKNSNN